MFAECIKKILGGHWFINFLDFLFVTLRKLGVEWETIEMKIDDWKANKYELLNYIC